VAVVPEAIGEPSEVDRVAQRLRRARALGDGGLVEDAEAEVGGHLGDGSRWVPPPAALQLPRIALPAMFLIRVWSRWERLPGLPFDFFSRFQNSPCSFWVR